MTMHKKMLQLIIVATNIQYIAHNILQYIAIYCNYIDGGAREDIAIIWGEAIATILLQYIVP